MITLYFKKLIGPTCYLTPVSASHAEIVAAWSNDPQVSAHTGDIAYMIPVEKQQEYLESMRENGYAFLIVMLTSDHPVGLCRLKNVDMINRTATLGIFIGDKEYWNRGLGTEATKLLLDFGFNVLNLRNIMLQVFSFNQRAIRSYEKCGFREIGRRRKAIMYGNKHYDEVYMDILAEEFNGSLIESLLNLTKPEY